MTRRQWADLCGWLAVGWLSFLIVWGLSGAPGLVP